VIDCDITFCPINVVAQRGARLAPGWVTVFGQVKGKR